MLLPNISTLFDIPNLIACAYLSMQVSAAAGAARLRRICEMKPSQKLNCPQWLHDQWSNPRNRPDLLKRLESVGWDKD